MALASMTVLEKDAAYARIAAEFGADGTVSREAADELFAVERAGVALTPEWTEFFVEMITRHVIRQSDPAGVVSEERATWLLTRVDECKSVEALAALVNVLAEASSVPQWFLDAGRARVLGGWPSAGEALPAATTG